MNQDPNPNRNGRIGAWKLGIHWTLVIGHWSFARRAFTLLELLIAVSIFAIVLAAINAVFYSALRLRNRAAAIMDKNVPIEHALAIIRRDLLSIVPPGTNLLGPLQTTSSSNLVAGANGPVFYCSSGAVDETS